MDIIHRILIKLNVKLFKFCVRIANILSKWIGR